MNSELIKKAMEATSAEELTELAKENGIDLAEDAAKAIFDSFNMTGELEDDELGSVAGGDLCGGGNNTNAKFCKRCGGTNITEKKETIDGRSSVYYYCNDCHRRIQ